MWDSPLSAARQPGGARCGVASSTAAAKLPVFPRTFGCSKVDDRVTWNRSSRRSTSKHGQNGFANTRMSLSPICQTIRLVSRMTV